MAATVGFKQSQQRSVHGSGNDDARHSSCLETNWAVYVCITWFNSPPTCGTSTSYTLVCYTF